jgi:putative transposase
MPRTARASQAGYCYHVINRGNGRAEIFHNDDDYLAFVHLIAQACERIPMRVLGWCLMPNHFHLVVQPYADGDLGRWMQWLLTSHVRRYHRHYGGSGHVWQGRFKAFPIQEDEHLLTVLRYVERNALRAKLVRKAENWRWSSLAPPGEEFPKLDRGPVPRGRNWKAQVNRPQSEAELKSLRESVNRGAPFGSDRWRTATAKRLGLEFTLNPRGRPRKTPEK